MAIMEQAEVQIAANIFANEFKNAGLFGGENSDLGRMQRQMDEATKNKIEADEEATDSVEEFSDKVEKASETTNSFSQVLKRTYQNIGSYFSVAALSRGVGQGVQDFSAQLKSGAIDTGGALDQMYRSFKLAVDPEVMSQLQNQNRAAVIAMGGVETWATGLADARDSLFRYTGDIPEALALASGSFETMRLAGVDPLVSTLMDGQGNLVGFGKSLRDVAQMTSMNMSEVNEMIKGFVETDEVRFKLAGRRDKQGALAELAQRQQLLLSLGYTAAEAQRAGTALDQLAGKGPQDRIKQAANAMAALGAAGMGAQGREIQKIIMLGQRQGGIGTAEGSEKYAKIMGEYQERIAKTATGSLAGEFAQMAIYTKLGMEQGKTFVNIASEQQKTNLARMKDEKTVGEAQVGATDLLLTAKILKGAILDHPGIALIAGGIGSSVSLLKFIAAQLAIQTASGGMKGKVAGGMNRFLTGKGGTGMKGKASLASRAGATGGAVAIAGLMAMTTSFFQGATEHAAKEGSTVSGIITHGFGEIGNDILGILDSMGLDATKNLNKVGKGISDFIFNIFHGGDVAKATQTDMIAVNKLRAQRWAQSTTNTNLSPQVSDAQTKLNEAFMNIARQGGDLFNAKDAVNPQLNTIEEILKELKIPLEKAAMLSDAQAQYLANIAKDGELTQKEIALMNKRNVLASMRE